ncbi:LOW QUALITY PROTEIN: hypothetical protein BT93_I0733 [Corymbia citriodora subsp. variegata]|nr:LOW QUALITY PROTEIN: hypothetical protein BT93_I0733 [Corymbia citriodora subsp. variegata]
MEWKRYTKLSARKYRSTSDWSYKESNTWGRKFATGAENYTVQLLPDCVNLSLLVAMALLRGL